MTSLTLHLDDEMKEKLETYASKTGQSLLDSVFYLLNLGIETTKCDDKESIDIDEDFDLDGPYTEEEEALFYSPKNVEAILKAQKELDEGKGITMTYEEFKKWSNELREKYK